MPGPVIKSAQGTEDKPVIVMMAQSCVVTNLFEITCLPTMPVVKCAQGTLAEDKPVTICDDSSEITCLPTMPVIKYAQG
jgi:hypothetical protein